MLIQALVMVLEACRMETIIEEYHNKSETRTNIVRSLMYEMFMLSTRRLFSKEMIIDL